ncbi:MULTISPECIES: type I glyceraldehyde-3-phosphate dehydrogenase [Peptoniphilus]|uniref:type I glyceraldehyde-3-phosphate dehydrogenase n=1 Tax=Peptoniphilus TaxID=162289 RepID=UPI0001DA9A97|nr:MULTISPECIES: type I glyceraldehyde-3-phosphate dehydrogenase [Peptoniphilus]EFI41969.1 glyceraldehyde-3-phosphate dehydrogenase, type I [Peptoniphilus sp. oral taxon 386 str. F0131]
MSVKVAIMGFGRIGRDVLRGWSLRENTGYEICYIADLKATERIKEHAHLFEYDSIYRRYPGEVKVVEDGFTINGKKITVLDGKAPAEMNWGELGVDIVIESTGAFTQREKAEGHIAAGAKKVIITAPAKGEDITIVMGVNDNKYDSAVHNIISNASCTTNCLAPVTKVILENFGIERGLMTTIHAYTNDQKIHDAIHKDMRRARMGAENMVPTTTGAAQAVAKVIPEVEGILTGMAVRVPVPTGSIVDVTFEISKAATAEEINAAIKKATENELKGVLEYSEEDLVSSDIVQNPHSSIFDAKLTLVKDRLVKCISWYDNEWGYSQRVVDLTAKVAGLL